jgi:hypothetical protein
VVVDEEVVVVMLGVVCDVEEVDVVVLDGVKARRWELWA